MNIYNTFADATKAIGRSFGLQISRRRPVRDPIDQFHMKLQALGVQTVFDIGANRGQFGMALCANGFTGQLVSFEPLQAEHASLKALASKFPNWTAFETMALGAQNGEASINVAANGASSSLLEVAQTSLDAAPQSGFTGQEKIRISRFDALSLAQFPKPWAMKIDTQGFELEVLRGAGKLLDEVILVLMEMSLVELYKGGASFADLFSWMENNKYRCIGMTQGFANDQTHELLQVDGLFIRQAT